MTQSDRRIEEKDRCSTCEGAGWTWSAGDGGSSEGRWVVCRECIGTGRTDQTGRKRQRPPDPPSA